jgi:hypothetical protein
VSSMRREIETKGRGDGRDRAEGEAVRGGDAARQKVVRTMAARTAREIVPKGGRGERDRSRRP